MSRFHDGLCVGVGVGRLRPIPRISFKAIHTYKVWSNRISASRTCEMVDVLVAQLLSLASSSISLASDRQFSLRNSAFDRAVRRNDVVPLFWTNLFRVIKRDCPPPFWKLNLEGHQRSQRGCRRLSGHHSSGRRHVRPVATPQWRRQEL